MYKINKTSAHPPCSPGHNHTYQCSLLLAQGNPGCRTRNFSCQNRSCVSWKVRNDKKLTSLWRTFSRCLLIQWFRRSLAAATQASALQEEPQQNHPPEYYPPPA